MKVDKKIQIPISTHMGTPLDIASDFDELLKEIINERPNVAEYLKTLDSQSTVTFNHSVNVALLTYYKMASDNEFTKNDIKNYVSAALVHDAGKLTTPQDILHSKVDYRTLKNPEDKVKADEEVKIMMRHSIDGYDVAKTYGFNKEERASCITHHIDSKVLENGLYNKDFTGATNSRWSWKITYEKDYIENLLSYELNWIKQKDVNALEIISFCDVVEATRSTERSYRGSSKEWGDIVPKTFDGIPQTVSEIMLDNVNKSKMNENFLDDIYNDSFRRHVDFFQSCGAPQRARELVNEVTRNVPYVLSNDKINEVLNNPELGLMFYAEKDTDKGKIFVLDVGDGREIEVQSKIVPDFEMSEIVEENNDIELID